MSEIKKIYVDASNIETIILGVNAVCSALSTGPYSYMAAGIARGDRQDEQGRNALEFVNDYYDLTAGVVELIAGAIGIIADGISNGEIELTVRSCEGQETAPSDGEGVNT